MLTQVELLENPVVLTVAARDGLHTVTAERLRGGRMRMGCSCPGSARHGWCMHRVRLLCLDYTEIASGSQDGTLRLEEMVTGTALAQTADEVDLALADFEAAQQALADAPRTLDPAALQAVAGKASDLAEAAHQLERAVERLKRRLAGAG